MRRNHNSKGPVAGQSLVGELVSSSAYDEVFLNSTDGYCIFDEKLCLQAFSSEFPNLYPSIKDKIKIGVSYAEYLRIFAENSAIQNLGRIDDLDAWVDNAVSKLSAETSGRYKHHLNDGRWMLLTTSRTSTGHWLFLANDITDLQSSQIAVQENQQRYRAFAHLMMDWFWELDADLKFVYVAAHRPEFVIKPEFESEPLIGTSRIDFISNTAVKNAAMLEHNSAFLSIVMLMLCWSGNAPIVSRVMCTSLQSQSLIKTEHSRAILVVALR